MKNTIALALIAITFAASAFARSQAMVQSQAQDFSVTAKDTRDGLVLWVKELGSGRLLFNKVINSVALKGDLNVARRAALAVTSQNSGPKMPIASGVFLITRDTLSSGIYKATVHRARPDEVRLVAPPQTPSTPPPIPSGTAVKAEDVVIDGASQWRIRPAIVTLLQAVGWEVTEPTVGSSLIDAIAFTREREMVQFKFESSGGSTIVHIYAPPNQADLCRGTVLLARVAVAQ